MSARPLELPLGLAMLTSALVAVLVRVPFLSWPLTVDEGGYAYGARWWFGGLTLYSDDLWFDRPQGIFLAYHLGMALLGDSVEALRLNGAVWAAATAAVVALIASRVFDRRVGAIAGLLCAVAGAAPAIEGFTANAEVFMVAAASTSAYCLWGRRWLLAGLLAGCAILLKPSGAAAGLLAVFWLAYEGESWRSYATFALGASIPLIASAIHGIATAGFEEYWFAVIWFRATAGGQDAPFLSLLAGWFQTAPLWLVLGVLAYPARGRLAANRRGRAFVGAWFCASILGMAMGGNWFPHYFQQLVPPLAVAAAVGVVAMTEQTPFARWSPVIGTAVVVLVGALLIVPMASIDPDDGAASVFSSDDYRHIEDVGEYVAAITEPTDQVYIAASHTSILFLTGRQSSFRYLYLQQLTEIPSALDEAAADLEAGDPAIVVVYRAQLDSMDRGSLRPALERCYRFDRSFGGFEVWTRQPPALPAASAGA